MKKGDLTERSFLDLYSPELPGQLPPHPLLWAAATTAISWRRWWRQHGGGGGGSAAAEVAAVWRWQWRCGDGVPFAREIPRRWKNSTSNSTSNSAKTSEKNRVFRGGFGAIRGTIRRYY